MGGARRQYTILCDSQLVRGLWINLPGCWQILCPLKCANTCPRAQTHYAIDSPTVVALIGQSLLHLRTAF